MTAIKNLSDSNIFIKQKILENKPFSLIRFGIGNETYLTYHYSKTKKINKKFLHKNLETLYNAGIYTKNKNDNSMLKYCQFYEEAIINGDILAAWAGVKNLIPIQNFYFEKYSLPKIHTRSLEPFYVIANNEIPWSHSLLGKKVLIIHPFIDSFKKQLAANFQFFKDKPIFLPGQEFEFYKTFQTIAGNHIHENWIVTFEIMCKDIEKIDFDIALLGCGGYGLPLCNFIKMKLNKSAIYIGGGLQLLFGVIGKRWDNHPLCLESKKNGNRFIRPSGSELCPGLKSIEKGCYW